MTNSKRPNLTNEMVRKLQPRAKAYDVRDGAQRGFYVRIFPSGVKTYRCEYGHGKSYTIGRADEMSVAKAHSKAGTIRGDVKLGLISDPLEDAKKEKLAAEREQKLKITFSDYLEQKYRPYFEATYPKTMKAAIKNLKRNFNGSFGNSPLSRITQSRLLKWRLKRQKATRTIIENGEKVQKLISPATVNRNIGQLGALCSHAVQMGYITENPTKGIEELATEAHKTRFLSKQEYLRLLEQLDKREAEKIAGRKRGNDWRKECGKELYPDLSQLSYVDHLKPMSLVALGSGIRFGSLVRLQWDKHIDFAHDNIVINLTADIVKVGKAYDVPLDLETSKVLRKWYKQNESIHQGKDWVFPGKVAGKHITSVKNAWTKLKKDAGIENFTWHDQRHDYASQLVMSGADLYTVMDLLGHSDPKTTKKYAHLAKEHKVKAAQELAKRRGEMLNGKK